MKPLVSVIIPTYNYAAFINEAIDSIIEQDYPKDKIEIIVVDDGSTDNTKDVLKDLIKNDTIKYYYQENKGKASATFKAIKLATGKYIFNLDADDYFLPGKLQKAVAVFENDESIVHVANPAKQISPGGNFQTEPIPADMMGKPLDGDLLLKRFMQNNMLFGGGSTYAARASALKKINIPKAVDMFTDEFLILAVLPFGKSYFIPDELSVWRGHGSNYSITAQSLEKQMAKSQRLLSSSDGVLDYLKINEYDKELIKIYRLKNLTHKISFKESYDKKTLRDIQAYIAEVFFELKPGWQLIKKYHVLNRLVPTPLFNLLKNFFPNRKNFLNQV